MKITWQDLRLNYMPHLVAGVVLALTFGWLTYMIADNEMPYTYFSDGSYIVPAKTHEGQQVTVHWKLRVNRQCPGAVQRVIIDSLTGAVEVTYDYAPAALTNEVGLAHLDRAFLLPTGITPGPKKYRANLMYSCNLLQRLYPLRGQTPTLDFIVVSDRSH